LLTGTVGWLAGVAGCYQDYDRYVCRGVDSGVDAEHLDRATRVPDDSGL
jgi:hypothetical protein